jgi:hypothetical protein
MCLRSNAMYKNSTYYYDKKVCCEEMDCMEDGSNMFWKSDNGPCVDE